MYSEVGNLNSTDKTPSKLWRKKPVVIEAMEYKPSNIQGVWDWAGADHIYGPIEGNLSAYILTLEGRMECKPGDYIIKGVQGEFYPCKPDIFLATYDAVVPEPSTPSTAQ